MKKYTIKRAFLFILLFAFIFVVSSVIYQLLLGRYVDVSKFDKSITYALIAMLSFITLTYTVATFLTYSYIKRRNDDIQLSKINYYYSKPYIIKINNKGIIQSFNQVFESKIKDYSKYKNIYDLDYLNESYDRLEDVFKQQSFTSIFDSNKGSREFIKFLPLKTNGGYYLLGEDITNEQKNFDYHRNMALYNNVTKIPNKNYLGIKLQELFDDSNLIKKKNSLVGIDIIGFKNINKLFGNKIGDETLVEIARIIEMTLEGFQATLFNPEADKFMVLFTDLSKFQDVSTWVNKLFKVLTKPLDVQGNLFIIEIKVGIFHIETDKYIDLNSVSAFDNTTLALKKAKASRITNTVVYDIGLGQLFTREQAMEIDLVNAIKNKELNVFLQPQLNNVTNKVVGFEALIRWSNPKYKNESPIHFIELAEQNNLIVQIGRFVIDETFRIAKELESHDVKISINVSPVQILHSGFVHDVVSAYEKYKLKTGSICLEITETFLMESFDEIVDKLYLLKNRGFSIHLDNFGTGYSSMLYLKDLPIDAISIDKEFIKTLSTDKYTRAIVSKIISLAKSLDIEVIAEGVEDERQSQFLKENGCHIIQGYLISKAVPKEEAIDILLKYNEKIRQFANYEF